MIQEILRNKLRMLFSSLVLLSDIIRHQSLYPDVGDIHIPHPFGTPAFWLQVNVRVHVYIDQDDGPDCK